MQTEPLQSLQQLSFDDSFVTRLPADPETANYRRQVRNACFSFVDPTPVSAPQLVAYSQEMLAALDLDAAVARHPDFTSVLTGNRVLTGTRPYAMCYGGHQFGHWAGQLGDGRAILLGDVINRSDQRWSLQLKGAGPTPYSRNADGLAVLRSSLREFLCSEAMYHLGVPTTRALSLTLTGDQVTRDMFYDGNPQAEPGAVVCRVAPSFLRFGNFQILAAQRDLENLKKLADYTIETFFPQLLPLTANSYAEFFDQVCSLTAAMVVHWQRVGFVHGVMNTDNMSVLGLTIDYGPYGWLEDFDPDWTPNTTDANGRRYRYAQQPVIAQWNLLQLAEAILHLTEDPKPLEASLNRYKDLYESSWADMVASKLGFAGSSETTHALHRSLEQLLQRVETDMTLFYRALARIDLGNANLGEAALLRESFAECWYVDEQVNPEYLRALADWIDQYQQAVQRARIDEQTRSGRMNAVNPKYVLRNYLAQLAIDKVEAGDFSLLHELMEVLRHPYDEQPQYEMHAQKRPEWARHRAGCSMLSCSS